jgi:hypothetical protein
VNRWLGTLVSTTRSNACPQNGHWIFPETSIGQFNPVTANRKKFRWWCNFNFRWGERPREPILDCGDMPPLSKRGRVRALQIELSLKNPRQPR